MIWHTELAVSHPDILLLHHSFLSKLTTITEHWGLQKIGLEGDFNNSYDTYIIPDSQVEALSLLTPDVMELLQAGFSKASLQFNGQSMAVSIETGDLSPATITPLLQSVTAWSKK